MKARVSAGSRIALDKHQNRVTGDAQQFSGWAHSRYLKRKKEEKKSEVELTGV
jgi:uncharacterized protein YraI